ncbi:MAG TPA: FHA domain-containing protein [Methanobacterium sp.]|nr:FHA domain-containing protein [Methanobacterium sp.]
MNKKQLLGITLTIIAIGIVVAVIWSLNGVYGWLENETQEIVIALIMAIIAGALIEFVYKKLSPQSKMLRATQTRLSDHNVSLAKLILPNNNNIIVNGAERVIGREDFLGVVTSDKLYFIGKDHFKITRKGNSFYIQDLNTKNGTTVNGISLDEHRVQRLDDGDEIMVAKSLRIKYNEQWDLS